MSKILVIDDNVDTCKLLRTYLTRKGFEVDSALTGKEGLNQLKEKQHEVILCDYRLPDMNGLAMIDKIKEINSESKIIIITGYSDVNLAVKSIKKGAYEYVTKPIMPDEILAMINKSLKHTNVITKDKKKNETSEKKIKSKAEFVKGSGLKSKQINKLIKLVSPTKMTVMLIGESGTGKEVTAKQIHRKSKRKNESFVAVDCGAIPKELAGSELFGHKKGAFTGALNDKKGVFELANKGTLFLDEIGNLSYDNQIKLLRVIQERTVKPIGSEKEIKVDVRIIVATNDDLKQKVNSNKFREDLYFRVNEFRIDLLPLRERKAELTDFIQFFLENSNQELDKNITSVDKKVIEILNSYSFPGNIRELRNMIKRAVLMCEGEILKSENFPPEIQNSTFLENNEADDLEMGDISDLKTIVEIAEKNAILSALLKANYNKSKAAKILGVDRKTLYNKISQYEIEI